MVDPAGRTQLASLRDVSNWVVVVRDSSQSVGVRKRVTRVVPDELFATDGELRLFFALRVDRNAESIEVTSTAGEVGRQEWKPKGPRKSDPAVGFFAADGRDNASVYLSGTWITQVHASPLYDQDDEVASPPLMFGREKLWKAGIEGTLNASDRPKCDADSYTLAVSIGRTYPVPLGGGPTNFDLSADVLRLEYSRADPAKNLLASVTGTVSFPIERKFDAAHSPVSTIDGHLGLGFELGHNQQNEIVPGGYGRIERAVPEASLSASFPGALGVNAIRWTSTYRARLLGTREPFVDDEASNPITLGRNPRHDWTDAVDVQISPLVGITLKHEYGALPPAFHQLNHRFTVAATVMWAWRE